MEKVYLVMKPRTAVLLLFEAYATREAAFTAGMRMFGKGKFTVRFVDILTSLPKENDNVQSRSNRGQ